MRLYAANLAYTTIDAPITAEQTTFTVTDPTNFPDEGMFIVTLGSEVILVQEIDKLAFEFKNVIRGYEGTVASPHDAESLIANKITAGYLNAMFQAIEDKLSAPGGVVTIALDLEDNLNVQGAFSVIGATALGDDVNLQGNKLIDPEIHRYTETYVTPTSGADTVTIDPANGHVFRHSITGGNISLAFTAPGVTDKAVSFTLLIKQDSTARTITWPASVTFAENEAPDAPDPNRVGIFTFMTVNNGARWYGMEAANHLVE